jgi:hypothetical protein
MCSNTCEKMFKKILKPKNIEEIYDIFYIEINYNLELILLFMNCRDSLGFVPIDIKKSIMLIVEYIRNIIKSFCDMEKYYSLYTSEQIFYSCMPFYSDYDNISIIKISKGVNFKQLTSINLDTPDYVISQIISELIDSINIYIPT